jgi:hypothetical protein
MSDLLSQLINETPLKLLQLYKTPQSFLQPCIARITHMFIAQEDHSSLKAIEVQLDCLEFFLSTIPESLVIEVGPICLLLLSLNQRIKRSELKEKTAELLQFIREILTSDLVLPHYI